MQNHSLTPVRFGRYFLCLLYESFMICVLLLFVGLVMSPWFSSSEQLQLPNIWQRYALFAACYLSVGGYFIYCWHHGGQTLPMKTWRLTITDLHLQKPIFSQLCLRYLWASVSVWNGTALLWAIFDKNHLMLHERFSGTQIQRIQNP